MCVSLLGHDPGGVTERGGIVGDRGVVLEGRGWVSRRTSMWVGSMFAPKLSGL